MSSKTPFHRPRSDSNGRPRSLKYANGDGLTSRDFCFVANAVQANLLAATVADPAAVNQVYNVAVGDQTDLIQLHCLLAQGLVAQRPGLTVAPPAHRDFRAGDVRHSRADVAKAGSLLGYRPSHDLAAGLAQASAWFAQRLVAGSSLSAARPSSAAP